MRKVNSWFTVITSTAALGASLAACESASSQRVGDPGAVRMALDIAGGATIATIAYEIAGPGAFTKAGAIDVSHSAAIAADISPLPPGAGFSIVLSAMSTDGGTMCMGSAGFDVAAHQTTAVVVHVLCRQATKNGSVSFNGALNVCPLIDSVGATPSEVFVGHSVALSAQGHDRDNGPSPLGYLWSASAGTLSDPSAQNPTFTCTTPGAVTVTVTLTDGDGGAGCPDTQTVTVTCTPGGGDAGGGQ